MGFIGTTVAVAIGVAVAPYVIRIIGFLVLASLFVLAFCSPPDDHAYSFSREDPPLEMSIATALDVVNCTPWTTVVTYPDVVTQRCGRWTLVSRLQESRE